jgi:hypothetical protein
VKPTWAESKVLSCAGIEPDKATEEEIELAGVALELCYYIDRAADWFMEKRQWCWYRD